MSTPPGPDAPAPRTEEALPAADHGPTGAPGPAGTPVPLGPLPGLTGLDHVGVTVPDLEEAHAFFVDVLGCEPMYALGPFQDSGSWMSRHLAVADDTVMRELRFYRFGGRAVFEVFAYEAAGQRRVPPRNSDVGGHHVALYTTDLDAAVAELHRRGLRVLGEPTASRGPSEGQRWVYFLSPWGMQFELVSYPGGKAFDRAGGTWPPA